MVRARRGASYRPISVVLGLFDFGRTVVALSAYAVLLWQLAPWALLLVVVAAIPVLVVDTKFSEETFRLFTWRARGSQTELPRVGPHASLDPAAETKIFERFRALAEDRMAILISHRFSTVRMADTIAVLHDGKVVERGTHEELLELGGRYARHFHMQARGHR